jgi:hypothetical protein
MNEEKKERYAVFDSVSQNRFEICTRIKGVKNG